MIMKIKNQYDDIGNFKSSFNSSVLHLRGEDITKQPFLSTNESTEGNILLFNGEIFKLQIQLSEKLKVVFEENFGKVELQSNQFFMDMENEETKEEIKEIEIPNLSDLLQNMDLEKGNDGKQLFEIFNCISLLLNLNKISLNMYKNLFEGIIYEAIEGDFAIWFYDNINQILVLSRDMFGKRSLLIQFDNNNSIAIMSASVLDQNYEIYEVPANAMIFLATSDTTWALSDNININDVFSFTINDESKSEYSNWRGLS